ncbi:MAG: hypothetical protein JNK58_10710 [Phycisphaerae bacterium]|nr:hypothetical protein [Phycisphaerae bacterium]
MKPNDQANPSASPPLTGTSSGPLSAEHMRAIADARVRARRVRRAASVASFSGWTMMIFGALTMAGIVFGDFTAFAFGVALIAVAWNELRGGALVRRFEARGARVLGYNQFFLGVIIVGYAAASIFAALRSPMMKGAAASTGDPNMDAMIQNLSAMLTYGLYGGMVVVGIVAPSLTAWYYFSRERLIRAMASETPAWVIEALRAAG